jgi:hypothetical protein
MTKDRPIEDFADKLFNERPRPTPLFRSEVRSRLLAGAKNRPAQIRARIFSFAAAGTLLLAVAALSVAGAGPLAAG